MCIFCSVYVTEFQNFICTCFTHCPITTDLCTVQVNEVFMSFTAYNNLFLFGSKTSIWYFRLSPEGLGCSPDPGVVYDALLDAAPNEIKAPVLVY